MRVLILYESLFGNTRTIAEAVADGVRAARPGAVVDCRRVDDHAGCDDVDLVVLGAPTHFWGLTGALSREMESQYERRLMDPHSRRTTGGTRRATATAGMRTCLDALPPGRGRAAAAFDTCMAGPLTGGARRTMTRRLERAGYTLVAEPGSFLVEAVAGPLRPGEADRARAWGAALARALEDQDPPKRRHPMDNHDAHVLTAPDAAVTDRAPLPASPEAAGYVVQRHTPIDLTRIVTTTELVVGAVLVARALARRPGSTKALVTMGPGGWVSMKGGTVAVRRGSRPWGRPVPVQPSATRGRAPLWARALSAVPLQALTR